MIAELHTAISNLPNRKARLKGLTTVETVRLKVERAALLFRGAPIAIGVTLMNVAITMVVARNAIDFGLLMIWGGAMAALAMVRIGFWFKYRPKVSSGRKLTRFARLHIFFMGVNGALWGALAPLFAVYGMLNHAFLPFVIAGTAAGAVVSAGASWRAVLAFNIPALVPLAITFLWQGSVGGVAVAGVVFLYGIATLSLAISTQRMIDRSILLHSKNEKLWKALQKEVNEAHEAEARFRALIEASADITMIFSLDGKVVYASPAAERVFDVPGAHLLTLTTKDLVHPDDQQVFRGAAEKSLTKLGGVFPLPHLCMRADNGAEYVAFAGRLTNMLYVPGVEGIVFNGGTIDDDHGLAHKHQKPSEQVAII